MPWGSCNFVNFRHSIGTIVVTAARVLQKIEVQGSRETNRRKKRRKKKEKKFVRDFMSGLYPALLKTAPDV